MDLHSQISELISNLDLYDDYYLISALMIKRDILKCKSSYTKEEMTNLKKSSPRVLATIIRDLGIPEISLEDRRELVYSDNFKHLWELKLMINKVRNGLRRVEYWHGRNKTIY